MSMMLNLLIHFVIIVGVIAFIFAGIALIVNPHDKDIADPQFEVILRIIAVFAGLLAYYSSRAVGVSIPEIMLQAFAKKDIVDYALYIFLGPVVCGLLMASICIKRIESDRDIASRVTLLFMALTLFVFVESYIKSFEVDANSPINYYLLPNAVFILTVLLYLIFHYKPQSVRTERES